MLRNGIIYKMLRNGIICKMFRNEIICKMHRNGFNKNKITRKGLRRNNDYGVIMITHVIHGK